MDHASKLQVKSGQSIALLHAPLGVELDLGGRVARTDRVADADALVLFVDTFSQLDRYGAPILDHAAADEVTWVAYPTAGQLETDINRDRLHAYMRERGLRTVRQIALDDTWSAMRVRPLVH